MEKDVIEMLLRAKDELLSISNIINEYYSWSSQVCLRCILADIESILEESENAE